MSSHPLCRYDGSIYPKNCAGLVLERTKSYRGAILLGVEFHRRSRPKLRHDRARVSRTRRSGALEIFALSRIDVLSMMNKKTSLYGVAFAFPMTPSCGPRSMANLAPICLSSSRSSAYVSTRSRAVQYKAHQDAGRSERVPDARRSEPALDIDVPGSRRDTDFSELADREIQ